MKVVVQLVVVALATLVNVDGCLMLENTLSEGERNARRLRAGHAEDGHVYEGGACDYHAQAPVNLRDRKANRKVTLKDLPEDALTMFKPTMNYATGNFPLVDKHHTVQIDANRDGAGTSFLATNLFGERIGRTVGPTDYKLEQLHFHWGMDNKHGSEHKVGKKTYPMEAHFVHYNTKYASIADALDNPDGLLVIGVFFEVGKDENPALTPILDAHLQESESGEVTLENYDMGGIFKSMNMEKEKYLRIYSYPASLTTPPCTQSVTWIVLEQRATLSHEQMEMFREFEDHSVEPHVPMAPNYRNIQEINGRTIFYYQLQTSKLE